MPEDGKTPFAQVLPSAPASLPIAITLSLATVHLAFQTQVPSLIVVVLSGAWGRPKVSQSGLLQFRRGSDSASLRTQ